MTAERHPSTQHGLIALLRAVADQLGNCPSRIRAALTAVGAVTLSVLAMLAVGQAILYAEDSQNTASIAERAVARIEALSEARTAAADAADRTGQPACSPADIQALKRIAFASSYVSDVGRIADNRLACSALWGVLATPPLPSPRYTHGRVRLWHGDDLAASPYADTNLIARAGTFTVSAPSSFDGIDVAGTSHLTIETRDRSQVFRDLPGNVPTEFAGDALQRRKCSAQTDICAFVQAPWRKVLALPGLALATVVGIGVGTGLLLSVALVRPLGSTRRSMQRRLADAIRHNEIELVYQPLRKVVGHRLVGVEVLSRWRPPGETEISPSIFVPIASRLGLSPALFRFVLSRAIGELGDVLRERRDLHIAVNAEPGDLTDASMVRFIISTVAAAGVLPDQVQIEITEREDASSCALLANMGLLAAEGFTLLIDDFGTGKANFSHLAQSPFKGVKIDRMFVAAMNSESPLRSVLPGMYQIASELGLGVVIEGVETPTQDATLQRLAPKATGQGWLYGMPTHAKGIIAICVDNDREE